MRIHSLHLSNIRSYIDQTISFETGSTILSGDIGSGKTTILLALEFALFGILRGKTSPAEILRHGTTQGSVSLVFSVDNKTVEVKRVLKKSGDTITQQAGDIIIDGQKETLTATEIKAKVLSLLGYPDSLLSRSVNLFRYTVYTPQEQVKSILFESGDDRKDIIRKIFSLDSYQNVTSNINMYLTSLREDISRLQGRTDDMQTLREQYDSQQKQHVVLEKQLPVAKQHLNQAKQVRIQREQELEEKRKQKEEVTKRYQKIQYLSEQIENNNKTLRLYTRQKEQLEKNLEEFSIQKEPSFDKSELDDINKKIVAIRTRKAEFDKRFGELKGMLSQSQQIISKISTLDTCPTCKQDVGDAHKKTIEDEHQSNISVIEKKLDKINESKQILDDKESSLIDKKEQLLEKQQQFALFKSQQKRQEQDKKQLHQLDSSIKEVTDSLHNLEKEYEQAKKEYESVEKISDVKEKSALEIARREERTKDLELQDIKSNLNTSQRMLETLSKAIKEKKEIAERIKEKSSLKNWFQELFIPLTKTIEKKLLLTVYNEFNSFFMDWFSQLVEDDLLSARLDEEFTPIIEQNGFDTSVENLSGGERTSVALAYRLALNKVLNDHYSALKTTGLLILDEPTDGFSTQQLDTLRDVLQQSGVEQLIIVSHEQKLESLADNLVRVEKKNHESEIM
ncbi:MAG: hypothetical protein ACQESC_02025 [Nanobdellota archaeon]